VASYLRSRISVIGVMPRSRPTAQPLRNGFPRAVKAGTVIAHSLDMQFTPGPAREAAPAQSAAFDPFPANLPVIGREWRELSPPPALRDDEPHWQHVHVDIAGREGNALHALQHLPWRAKIELGVQALDRRPYRATCGCGCTSTGSGLHGCSSMDPEPRCRNPRRLRDGAKRSMPGA